MFDRDISGSDREVEKLETKVPYVRRVLESRVRLPVVHK